MYNVTNLYDRLNHQQFELFNIWIYKDTKTL